MITSKFGFSHIPKTGGTWVETLITRNFEIVAKQVPHTACATVQNILVFKPVFAAVRHPVDWWKSWYSFHKETQTSIDDVAFDHIGRPLLKRSLDAFVWRYFQEVDRKAAQGWKVAQVMRDMDIGPLTFHLLRICSENPHEALSGNLDAKLRCEIGRTEYLREDFAAFLNSVGCLTDKVQADIANSQKENIGNYLYSDYLGSETVDLILHKERKILEVGGYV